MADVENAASKVIVIGGSAGALEALLEILAHLPADIPAAIFVVVHIPADANSYLPKVLSRCAAMEARHPADAEKALAGRIYVAPPNFHLTLSDGAIRISRGPRENRHRPAIDPLFRTAARSFGRAAVAVVLSGNLDDGSAGLLAVRTRGGVGIVQDPLDAKSGQMPQRALEYAGSDFVLPASEIGPKLIELINAGEKPVKKPEEDNGSEPEVREHEEDFTAGQGNGEPSVFACPECHGVLWEMKDGELVRYRCRVGHAYTASTLKLELDDSAERALWAAMRALEEKAAMGRRMVTTASGSSLGLLQRLQDQVDTDAQNAEIIRKMIFSRDEPAA